MIVVKVGGSLFDLPDLKARLSDWLAERSDPDCLLVPGGGSVADAVRQLDRAHGLDASAAHWLALRGCTVNAHLLQALLAAPIVCWPTPGQGLAILDALAFALADEGHPGAMPHSWDATSDSLAARVTTVAGAELVLLKSVTIPPALSWEDAAAAGYVDPLLPEIILRNRLRVRSVNLRS